MTQPRLVGARYELGELVGYGGMAEVHRGRDTRLNREVAIKVLRADLARDPSFLNRFRREAHSAAGLNHPAIVAVYDTGEDIAPDGTPVPFIVMEYVEGRTLRDILKSEGRLPGPRAMEITAQICSALEFSHRNGIIHRDIKPANVMITRAGAVKVMDFGIARAVADTSATITQTANVIGTAQYLSPEQARGESVDARSDVYSTGCLLYELVTGVPPFQGDSPVAVAYQHVRENPVPPSARNPELPRVIDSIVMKSLAKNQFNRYQSAGEMGADVERALADRPVVAEAVMTDAERTQFIARTPPPPAFPPRQVYEPMADDDDRRGALIWVAVVVALLVVIGGAAFLIFGRGSNAPQMVAIPPIIGQVPQAADQTLQAAGLDPRQGTDSPGPCEGGQNVRDGSVCTTSPATGTKLAKGATVTYHLKKTATASVPDVGSKSYNDATAELHAAGLRWVRVPVDSAEPVDTVLTQNPAAYSTVPPNSVVRLRVSTGKVKLQDITGMEFEKAKALLNQDFPNVHETRQITRRARLDGTVAAEDPTPGIAYDPSTTITLTVYRYVAPAPSCIPSPSLGSESSSSSTSSSSSSSSGSTSVSSGANGVPYCTTTTDSNGSTISSS